jgi:hypothetical protein
MYVYYCCLAQFNYKPTQTQSRILAPALAKTKTMYTNQLPDGSVLIAPMHTPHGVVWTKCEDESPMEIETEENDTDNDLAAAETEEHESRIHEVSGESLDAVIEDAVTYKFGDINNWRYGIICKQKELEFKDTTTY